MPTLVADCDSQVVGGQGRYPEYHTRVMVWADGMAVAGGVPFSVSRQGTGSARSAEANTRLKSQVSDGSDRAGRKPHNGAPTGPNLQRSGRLVQGALGVCCSLEEGARRPDCEAPPRSAIARQCGIVVGGPLAHPKAEVARLIGNDCRPPNVD